MRILITNDDGINAPGLKVLREIAQKLTDDDNIFTIAPSNERSGVGHCISYNAPVLIEKTAKNSYSVSGYPADCVISGIHHVMKNDPPSLILSGVNKGNNSAENVLYSGTIGAAIEGALQGITSIALSQYLGPESEKMSNPFNPSINHSLSVINKILDKDIKTKDDYKVFYNVNFPPTENIKGMKVVPQGLRPNTTFSVSPFKTPNGKEFLFVKGGNQHIQVTQDSDVAANLSGFISLTPMRANLTAFDKIKDFE